MLPPRRSRIFEKTNLSAMLFFMASVPPTFSPASSFSVASLPTLNAQVKILALAPPSDSAVCATRA